MGTTAHIVVLGDGRLLDHAVARLADLEQRWSRFIPTSELCRLNANAGRPCVVSLDTRDVVALAVQSWYTTGGLFDPTVLSAVKAAGYDRTFAEVSHAPPIAEHPTPGCAHIEVGTTTVTLPHGVGLDLGGIGKGYAADLIATELLARGARGACVNIGGDLRAVGDAPTEDGWVVSVDHPLDPTQEAARIAVADGAVATTSRTKRTWGDPGRRHHHLVDPDTGTPARTRTAVVTVVADEGWRAETLAKAAFLGLPVDHAVTVTDDGIVHHAPALEAFLV
ncbi:MAG TPA: FAD:protein FMN transferase [Acidimicrobiales bacterium]|jgi:thiamine biosynthesis lipoprotein